MPVGANHQYSLLHKDTYRLGRLDEFNHHFGLPMRYKLAENVGKIFGNLLQSELEGLHTFLPLRPSQRVQILKV